MDPNQALISLLNLTNRFTSFHAYIYDHTSADSSAQIIGQWISYTCKTPHARIYHMINLIENGIELFYFTRQTEIYAIMVDLEFIMSDNTDVYFKSKEDDSFYTFAQLERFSSEYIHTYIILYFMPTTIARLRKMFSRILRDIDGSEVKLSYYVSR